MQIQRANFYDETVQGYYDRGWAKGSSEAILAVLEARGLAISDEQRKRIVEMADFEVLYTWARRAAKIASVDELFG